MRAWLDENLLFNLEKNFRCMTPSKLFPIWLADACLRGEGSTITTVKFFAIPPTQVKDKEAHARWEYGNNTTNENPPDGRGATRVELRSIVGRMLWKEVWGSYITADKWWWEDPACIEECTTMGTFWEYSLIEAVKEA